MTKLLLDVRREVPTPEGWLRAVTVGEALDTIFFDRNVVDDVAIAISRSDITMDGYRLLSLLHHRLLHREFPFDGTRSAPSLWITANENPTLRQHVVAKADEYDTVALREGYVGSWARNIPTQEVDAELALEEEEEEQLF